MEKNKHFLVVNIWPMRDSAELVPERAVNEILAKEYPSLTRIPGDQLLIRFEDARKASASEIILKKLEKEARLSGPAIAFRLVDSGVEIEGLVKKYQIQFKLDEPAPDEVVAKLKRIIGEIVPENIDYDLEYY